MNAVDWSADSLVAGGLVASVDAVAGVSEYRGLAGGPDPEWLLQARLMRGFDVDVLASRGFDIGAVHFRGIPISWFSPVRDARALPAPSGDQWLTRFNGGLVTTCGLGNIGPARGAEGLHGDFSHHPAHAVAWAVNPGSIELTATIDCAQIFGPSFRVQRRIASTLTEGGAAELRIVDLVSNVGAEAAAMSALYHVNFGAPLVVPGTAVDVPAGRWVARDANPLVPGPAVLPPVASSTCEEVFEHHELESDGQGFARVVVRNPELGLAASVVWSLATLPRLYQWVLPTRNRWALGIEPANAPLFGPDRAGPGAGAPVLAPGQTVRHELAITVRELAGPESG